jgi:hypothetical protein
MDGGQAPTQTAQGEEDERAPEGMLDSAAELRQTQWDAAITTLRQIDPSNAQLSSITAPGWVPSQADLDILNTTVNQAETRRVIDRIMPNGMPIGATGTSSDI